MGYQESIVKFRSVDDLKNEMKKYQHKSGMDDVVHIYNAARTIKGISPFKKGELVLIVGGERYVQRSPKILEEELGIEEIQSVVFIDNPYYWDLSGGNIDKLIGENFAILSREEYEKVINGIES